LFVMCEHGGMSQMPTPTTAELSEAAGISKGYASDILNGKRPNLGRPIAIHIYRKTRWKHPSIAALTEDQIDMLEEIEPWSSPREAA
jgi:transcriptional regulator with XRE-family HTH domain